MRGPEDFPEELEFDPLELDRDGDDSVDPEDVGYVPDNNDFFPYELKDFNLGEMEER